MKNLADNTYGFSQEHMDLVKQSIRLADGDSGTLYGKTGTVSADGKNISGWLVGYVETNGRNLENTRLLNAAWQKSNPDLRSIPDIYIPGRPME